MKSLKENGIDHVGYVVSDFEKTVQHIKDYYGIDDFKFWEFNPLKAWAYGKPVDEYKLKVGMATINDGGACIEIITPITEYGYHYDFIKSGKNGLNHLCFKVEDYPYWREHFIEKCGEFLFEAEIEDDLVGYRRCFYADDPVAGMVYEIREIPHFRK